MPPPSSPSSPETKKKKSIFGTMALKARLPLPLLLFSLLFVTAALALPKEDPELKKCKHKCKDERQFDEQQRRDCKRSCEEKVRERQQEGGNDSEESYGEEENPYVFQDEHFESRVKTEEGRVQVLENFAKRSKLLSGIENFRLAILEANPHTFISPAHFDAELVLFVAKGT
jgi:hypothetical protein